MAHAPSICDHGDAVTVRPLSDLVVRACDGCGSVAWSDDHGRPVDPDVAVARVFGRYVCIGELEAVPGFTAGGRHPGTRRGELRVFAYRPPTRRARARLSSFPRRRWLPIAPELWMSTDGHRLLLRPDRPIHADNLRAAARRRGPVSGPTGRPATGHGPGGGRGARPGRHLSLVATDRTPAEDHDRPPSTADRDLPTPA